MPLWNRRRTRPRDEALDRAAREVSATSSVLLDRLAEARTQAARFTPPDRPTDLGATPEVTRQTLPTGDQSADALLKSSYLTSDVSNRSRKISLYQAYLGETFISGAIEAIAARLISGGWTLKAADPRRPNPATREPLQEFLDWCNPDEEFHEVLHSTATDLLWCGEAYWEITYRPSMYYRREIPYELYTVDPISMDYVLAPNHKQIGGYVQLGEDGIPVPLDLRSIVRFWFPDPRNRYRGLSPLEKALNPVVTDTYLQLSDQKFFQQGNRAGTAILVKNGSRETAGRLLRWITEQYLGVKNAHKPLVLFGEQGDVELQTTPDQATIDVLGRRKMAGQEIMGSYKVPPHLMSILENTGQGGQAVGDTMEKQFVHTAVDPLRQRIMSTANFRVTVQGFGIDDWVIDTTYADMRDSAAVLENQKGRIFAGLSTINKERAENNQGPIAGGDVPILLVGSQLVRVDSLTNLPTQPMPPHAPQAPEPVIHQGSDPDRPPQFIEKPQRPSPPPAPAPKEEP